MNLEQRLQQARERAGASPVKETPYGQRHPKPPVPSKHTASPPASPVSAGMVHPRRMTNSGRKFVPSAEKVDNMFGISISDDEEEEDEASVGRYSSNASIEEEEEHEEEDSSVILIIEVVIGEGQKASLSVRSGDTSLELATQFVAKHSLSESAIPNLEAHIDAQLRALEQEDEEEEQEQEDLQEEEIVSESANSSTTSSPSRRWMPEAHENDREDQYSTLIQTATYANSNDSATTTPTLKPAMTLSDKPTSSKSVFTRLFSAAKAREKWRAKAIRAKEAELENRIERNKVKMDEKSRRILRNRVDKYPSANVRLYHEGVADLARKDERYGRIKKEEQEKWMCPKCMYLNLGDASSCQNEMAHYNVSESGDHARMWVSNTTTKLVVTRVTVCDQPKPSMFQPTSLTTASASSDNNNTYIHSKLYSNQNLAARRERTAARAAKDFKKTCSFKPKLDRHSVEIVKQKRSQLVLNGKITTDENDIDAYYHHHRKNSHIKLYNEANIRRQKVERMAEAQHREIPFKPNIGLSSSAVPAPHEDDASSKQSFYDRLHSVAQQRREREEAIDASSDIDYVSGRKLFMPQTGRGPLFNRNEGNLPIGEFLFASRNEFTDIRQQKSYEYDVELRRNRERGFVSKASKRALEERKLRSFKEIFHKLLRTQSTDDTNVLRNTAAVDTSVLKPDTGRVVSNVLRKLGDDDVSFEVFRKALEEELLSVPGVTHSQLLFNREVDLSDVPKTQEEIDEAESTFQPEINRNSDAMTLNRRSKGKKSVYEALNQDHARYEARKDALRREKEQQIKRECTFNPKLVAHNQHYRDLYERLGYTGKQGDGDSSRDSFPEFKTSMAYSPIIKPIGGGDTNIIKLDDTMTSTNTSALEEPQVVSTIQEEEDNISLGDTMYATEIMNT